MSALDRERLNRVVTRANQELLAAPGPGGRRAGELAGTALATAAAAAVPIFITPEID